jgi:hypothetical protein
MSNMGVHEKRHAIKCRPAIRMMSPGNIRLGEMITFSGFYKVVSAIIVHRWHN